MITTIQTVNYVTACTDCGYDSFKWVAKSWDEKEFKVRTAEIEKQCYVKSKDEDNQCLLTDHHSLGRTEVEGDDIVEGHIQHPHRKTLSDRVFSTLVAPLLP